MLFRSTLIGVWGCKKHAVVFTMRLGSLGLGAPEAGGPGCRGGGWRLRPALGPQLDQDHSSLRSQSKQRVYTNTALLLRLSEVL